MRAAVLVVALAVLAAVALAADDETARPPDEAATARHVAALVANADALALKQDWTGAETHYREAIGGDADAAAAWHGLGHVLAMQGRFPDALAAFEETLRLAPDDLRAMEWLGEMYVALGRPDDAKAVLERLRPLHAPLAATLAHVIETGTGRW